MSRLLYRIFIFFCLIFFLSTQTVSADLCQAGDPGFNPAGDLTIDLIYPDYADASEIIVVFTNHSDECDYDVGVASYSKFDEVIDNQELYYADTGRVSAGESLFLSVFYPYICAAQIDIFYGELLPHLNGQRYGERLLWYDHVNGTNCFTVPVDPVTVNAIDDTDDGVCDDTHCSLREAVQVFDRGILVVFDESLNGTTITLNSPITVNRGLELRGLGMDALTITGTLMTGSAFSVTPPDGLLKVSDLTFVNFSFPNGGSVIDNVSYFNVEISNCRFANNSTTSDGGALIASYGAGFVIVNTRFEGNHADGSGGAIMFTTGNMTITDTLFQSNSASQGGAIFTDWGMFTVNNSTFINNQTTLPTSFDLHNTSTHIVDATNNYWGAVDGPSGFGPGSGDSVSDYVNFAPYSMMVTESTGETPIHNVAPVGCTTHDTHITVDHITSVCQSTSAHHTVSLRPLDAAGIGVQAVIAQGVLQAIDVSGWIEEAVPICMTGEGGVLFLDAAESPRTPIWLPATISDDMTCVTISTPGTVVLVEAHPESPDQITPETTLTNCRVTTQYLLNFRDAPDGQIIGQIPYDYTMTAIQRTADWFNVIFGDDNGWISAGHVSTHGDCD